MITLEELSRTVQLKSREDYKPFPRWGEKFDFPKRYAAQAEAVAGEPVYSLPATRYMDFQRNGNRSRYQDLARANHEKLMLLALAECQEGKGRFIDPLIDRI